MPTHSVGDIGHHYGFVITEKFISEKLHIDCDERIKRSFRYSDEKAKEIGKKMALYMRDRADEPLEVLPQIGKPKAVDKTPVEEAEVKSFDDDEEEEL